jgi:phospholipid-translocating ATPase
VAKVAEEIEKGFTLIGSTAIEDKLQDQVGEVISSIREAGVRFWVLTGDKIETAINIGFNCQVLDQEMEIFILKGDKAKEINLELNDFIKK